MHYPEQRKHEPIALELAGGVTDVSRLPEGLCIYELRRAP